MPTSRSAEMSSRCTSPSTRPDSGSMAASVTAKVFPAGFASSLSTTDARSRSIVPAVADRTSPTKIPPSEVRPAFRPLPKIRLLRYSPSGPRAPTRKPNDPSPRPNAPPPSRPTRTHNASVPAASPSSRVRMWTLRSAAAWTQAIRPPSTRQSCKGLAQNSGPIQTRSGTLAQGLRKPSSSLPRAADGARVEAAARPAAVAVESRRKSRRWIGSVMIGGARRVRGLGAFVGRLIAQPAFFFAAAFLAAGRCCWGAKRRP